MKNPDDFEDNKELYNYVLDIIKNISLTSSLKKTSPELYKFFVSLFQRHPEKDKKEVAFIIDISIRKLPIAQKHKHKNKQFFIIKSNGTEDSISWNKCVYKQEYSISRLLSWSFRDAIKEQIKEFKFVNKNKPCEICGTHEDITADHVIQFRKLKDDFLKENPEHPTEFTKNNIGAVIFRDDDIEFVKAWQEYHKKNAILRILCSHCNDNLDKYHPKKRRRLE